MKKYTFGLRVRYEETDQMGYAYYGNYFTWFEVARSEYFRDNNIPYTGFEKKGLYLPAVEATCKYEVPLAYDDLIDITVWISEIKNASMVFQYEIRKDASLIAKGKTIHAFINEKSKPVRVPDEVRAIYGGSE
ncbi:MAG: thioesterase family protein [Candidatus Ancaeobacter aquaticus]|nr:thioesterase family protein [Candidatus Ancaeobacter aquaticus]